MKVKILAGLDQFHHEGEVSVWYALLVFDQNELDFLNFLLKEPLLMEMPFYKPKEEDMNALKHSRRLGLASLPEVMHP
ncbi:MAG: hypothetical protein EZS28_044403, partial [Streblomastix strix]